MTQAPVVNPVVPQTVVVPTNLTTGLPVYRLTRLMVGGLNMTQLGNLAIMLGTNIDHISGSELESKSSNLIQEMGRRNRTKELLECLVQINSNVDWYSAFK